MNPSKSSSSNTDNLSWRAVLPWMVVLLLLINLPYAVAWLLPPEGKQFVGAFVNPDDLATYLAAMRQGGEGKWLLHLTFSPEPWQPKLMLLPYLLVGKVIRPLPGSILFWFHLFRLAAALLAMAAAVPWVRTLFPGRKRLQYTAWLLIFFGSGLGWLMAVSGLAAPWPGLMLDLGGPEWSSFMALSHTPHFALGLALEIGLMTAVLRLTEGEGNGRWAILAALLGVAGGLTYVYHIPVYGLVIGLYLLSLAAQQRRIPWRLWGYGLIVLLPLTALLVYYLLASNQDPYFANYARTEHVIPPPALLSVLVALGVLAILALAGLPSWRAKGYSWLPLLWIAGNFLALYAPTVQFSGRFSLGLMVPVAMLAAVGLEEAGLPWLMKRPFYTQFARLTPTPAATLRRVFLFLVVPSTVIVPFLLVKTAVTTPDFPTYVPNAEAEAAHWLGQQAQPDDLILAYYPMGNYLPRETDARLFVSQLDFTTDLPGKLALVKQFWQPQTSLAWRQALIEKWGIDYIYEGVYERSLYGQPVALPGEVEYDQGGVTIYRLNE